MGMRERLFFIKGRRYLYKKEYRPLITYLRAERYPN